MTEKKQCLSDGEVFFLITICAIVGFLFGAIFLEGNADSIKTTVLDTVCVQLTNREYPLYEESGMTSEQFKCIKNVTMNNPIVLGEGK